MHASAGRINVSLYILCLLMCRGGCNGSAGGFGSNDLGGEFSQSDSLLTHVLGGIIVAEPCICWESGCDVWTLVSATHSFSHAKILTVLVMLHVALCCIRPVELHLLHLLHYDAIGRYRLCRSCYIINMLFYNFER